MRTTRLLLIAAVTLALAASTAIVAPAIVTPVGAASGTSPFFSESNKAINQDGSYVPVVGNFGLVGAPSNIIWYAPGARTDLIWSGDGLGGFTKSVLSTQLDGVYTPIVGNFSGDIRDDILWYGAGASPDRFWRTIGSGQFQSLALTVSGTYTPVVIPDSFGRDDILWWNKSGPSSVWSFTGTGTNRAAHTVAPPPGTKPVVGDFNGDGHGDIFWYGPGAIVDVLWSGNGSGSYTKQTQVMNGSFTPIAHEFTPGSSRPKDDLLWYNSKGASILWQGTSTGRWNATTHSIPAGSPVAAEGEFGLVYIVRPGLPDWVWHLQYNSDIDYSAASHNTNIGPGYTPLVSAFVGNKQGIFWYKPGLSAEHLFYINFVA